VLDAFLDREQERYRGQLERYAAVLRKLDARPIRLGLYFPLLGGVEGVGGGYVKYILRFGLGRFTQLRYGDAMAKTEQ
jgi:hypothetical protein